MPPSLADAQIILLYGDDSQAIADAAAQIEAAALAASAMGDMNLSRFDLEDRNIGEEQIQAALYALPFLAEKRLVILRNPFARYKTAEACQRLIRLLQSLPPTTRVALIVPDQHQGSRGWEIMEDTRRGKSLLDWAKKAGGDVLIRELRLPRQSEMTDWILRRAKQEGGQFTPRAAAELAALTGNDTGIAVQEIRKLLTYVNFQRAVEVDDVQEVAASGGQADVFKMVDAIATGESRTALRHLKILLEEEDPIRLFGMIIRQYRLLILVREALEQGVSSPAEIAKRLKIHSFAAENLISQARRLNLTKLESAYRLILKTDQMIKSGQAEFETALQTLIVQLSSPESVP
ncbi:MAG: DNA polymerase III subunit delta [Bellilinea sp.]|nr:MAG: DNA polymerase III subunit delta [Bellilinea sp.]